MSCNRCHHHPTHRRCEENKHYRRRHCGHSHHHYSPSPCPPPSPSPCPPPYPPYPQPTYPQPTYPQPTSPQQTAGGWSSFQVPTEAQVQVFNQAVGTMIGAAYTPLYVATQVVNGTNYLFIAQQSVTNGGQTYTKLVTVTVYQAPNGTVTLQNIGAYYPK